MNRFASKIFTPNATSIVVSALVTGVVTVIGILIANMNQIIDPTFMGGMLVTAFIMVLKAIQKAIANYTDDKRIAKILEEVNNGIQIEEEIPHG